jgi:hypothetical protein
MGLESFSAAPGERRAITSSAPLSPARRICFSEIQSFLR